MKDPISWNKKLISANGSFLQSWEWGELQEKLGKKIFRVYENPLCGLSIVHFLPFGNTYLYFPHGPFGEWTSKNIELLLKNVLREANSIKPFFIRVDPCENASESLSMLLLKSGFKKTDAIQPEETLLLDLSLSEQELLQKMEHDTRYSIRTAEKRGVQTQHAENTREKKKIFDSFWDLFQKTNDRHSLRAYEKRYYELIFALEGECSSEVLWATLDGKTIATAIIVFFGKRATYLYAASEKGYGRYNAPTFLLWNAIRSAKIRGCNIFDFWGISKTKKEWEKITAFKKSFGGHETKYTGAWDFVLNPAKYKAYQCIKKIKKM